MPAGGTQAATPPKDLDGSFGLSQNLGEWEFEHLDMSNESNGVLTAALTLDGRDYIASQTL